MIYDVNRAFNRVLDQNAPLINRAVRYYELQIALLACNGSTDDPQAGSFTIRTSRKLVRSAQITTVIKLLAHELDNAKFYQQTGTISDALTFGLNFDVLKYILTGKGLRSLRFAMDPKHFDNCIDKLRDARIEHCSTILNVALRFDQTSKARLKDARFTGIHNCLSDVRHDKALPPSFRVPFGRTKLLALSRLTYPVMPLLYLMDKHRECFYPRKSDYKGFERYLYNGASDRATLLQILANHNYIVRYLSKFDYKFHPISVDFELPLHNFVREPLPTALIELI